MRVARSATQQQVPPGLHAGFSRRRTPRPSAQRRRISSRRVLNDGIAPVEIGISVRSEDELRRAKAAADMALIGTMHLAKGLDFRAIPVMACGEDVIPSPTLIADVAAEFERDEVMGTERQLLYVAIGRAGQSVHQFDRSREDSRSSRPFHQALNSFGT